MIKSKNKNVLSLILSIILLEFYIYNCLYISFRKAKNKISRCTFDMG